MSSTSIFLKAKNQSMAYLHLIQKFLARQSKYYNWKVKSFDLDLF